MSRLLTILFVLCFSFSAFANETSTTPIEEPLGLPPLVFYSGIAVTVGSAVGAVGAGVMSSLKAEELDQLEANARASGQPLDFEQFAEASDQAQQVYQQAQQALYALGATAILAGLFTWFIIEPLTWWDDEKAKTVE